MGITSQYLAQAEVIAGHFDEASISKATEPEFALIMGPVATGKTRFRREHYACGHVVLDAADIFIHLSDGKYVDFPSFLEAPMNDIGLAIALRAIREKRNIVTEIIGDEYEPAVQLIETMKSSGYVVTVSAVTADLEQSLQWNLSRSDNNISAYYTQKYHHGWLLSACMAVT